MLELKGKIEFEPYNVTAKHKKQSSWKRTAIVKFNDDLHLFYSWLLDRRFGLILNQPLRGTHITIISDIVDDDLYSQARTVFNNKEITFYYDPVNIRSNGTHWWINAQSDDVSNIRRSIGLDPTPYFGLHITIGLANERNKEHSEYILRCILRYGL